MSPADIERCLDAICAAASGAVDRERVGYALSTMGPIELLDGAYIFMGFKEESDALRDWLPVLRATPGLTTDLR